MIEEPDEDVRGGLGGIVALCVAIFFADASWSAAIPTFPSFAMTLGASLTMIGILAAASSISTTLSSIPLGSLSDRLGRRGVMLIGFSCFAVTPLMYVVSSDPIHLFVPRVLLGIAMGSTFSIGFVYMTELAARRFRSTAQGLYMTSMGIGFTLGPLIGGITAKAYGYATSFYFGACFGLAGLLTVLIAMRSKEKSVDPKEAIDESGSEGFQDVLADPKIVAAGAANFFNSMLFSATITFFPLYGVQVGFDESQVGVSLTARGLSSTASRFPTGVVARRGNVLKLMIVGLGMTAITLLFLPLFADILTIGLILGVQGVAYGIYLTAGNAYIAEVAPTGRRGTAIGVYSTFSNISGVVSPIFLGALAEAWGLRVAFQFSAALAMAGTILTLVLAWKGEKSIEQ